jgi:DNA-binding SARP family transcriptional activator/tetratricopeptide (TPR) repeat protein
VADDIVVRLLGPVEVQVAGVWSSAGTPQRRLLLAVLALRAGQVVPVAELIDAVWEERLPPSARAGLQALVTRLRQTLAGIAGCGLERCGDGYRLRLPPGRVDVHRFRALAGAGRKAADGQAGVRSLDEALALWRGPPLADVPGTASVEVIRSRLADEHLAVVQDRIGWLLASGMERAAAAELPALLARHPLAERLAGMFIVALCRCGQRADALQVFRDTRARLASELGVEPGPELQRLHQRILAGDAELAGPASGHGLVPRQPPNRAVGVSAGPIPQGLPRQLPSALEHFAGRGEELKALDDLVSKTAGADRPPVVSAIVGTAGVGKTTLAVHWAHQVAPRFPDGQLYVNLRGFGPSGSPATPEEAIRGFLQALGVSAGQMPGSLEEQAALYRSLLAGKRMLIVLDNARDAGQVRPLLPGGGGCLALVTSRDQLTGLVAAEGARPLNLDVLSQAEARELLARRLGEQRAAAEPEAVSELARLCARLPLALAITAARATARPGFSLSALAAELGNWQGRLDCLDTDDAASSVREVFSWSGRQLSGPAARLFRLLGIHPGPDISVAAAASLAGVSLQMGRRLLAELTRAHLLTEYNPGRFACHDLLRAYAAEQAHAAKPAQCALALRRVLDHYLHTANAAAQVLYPAREPLTLHEPQPGAAPGHPRDRSEALAWFAAEHQVLLAAATHAAAAGLDTYAWQLPAALTDFLTRQGYWHDLAAIQHTALSAARRLGDQHGQAHAHQGLGTAGLRLGRPGHVRHLERAIGLFHQLDDRARQARSQITLGVALSLQGRHREAHRQTEQALGLYREVGHRAGQAHALSNLGWLLANLGDYQAALTCCQSALSLHGEFGNLLGQAHTWDHLGYIHHCLGGNADAIISYQRALGLLQDVGDRAEEAGVLTRLGDAYLRAGDDKAAQNAWRRALDMLKDLHDPTAGGKVPQERARGPGR